MLTYDIVPISPLCSSSIFLVVVDDKKLKQVTIIAID